MLKGSHPKKCENEVQGNETFSFAPRRQNSFGGPEGTLIFDERIFVGKMQRL